MKLTERIKAGAAGYPTLAPRYSAAILSSFLLRGCLTGKPMGTILLVILILLLIGLFLPGPTTGDGVIILQAASAWSS
jgi:hypothetical protein